jgi:hypothetical protein
MALWNAISNGGSFEKLRFVGGDVEVNQVGLKAAGFYGAVGHAENHPDGAKLQGGTAEVTPDERADEEAEQGRKEI